MIKEGHSLENYLTKLVISMIEQTTTNENF